MTKQRTIAIADRLFALVTEVRYGTVVASLRLHEGRVVAISYEVTQITREREEVNDEA